MCHKYVAFLPPPPLSLEEYSVDAIPAPVANGSNTATIMMYFCLYNTIFLLYIYRCIYLYVSIHTHHLVQHFDLSAVSARSARAQDPYAIHAAHGSTFTIGPSWSFPATGDSTSNTNSIKRTKRASASTSSSSTSNTSTGLYGASHRTVGARYPESCKCFDCGCTFDNWKQ